MNTFIRNFQLTSEGLNPTVFYHSFISSDDVNNPDYAVVKSFLHKDFSDIVSVLEDLGYVEKEYHVWEKTMFTAKISADFNLIIYDACGNRIPEHAAKNAASEDLQMLSMAIARRNIA